MTDFGNAWASANPDANNSDTNDLEPPADGLYDVALIDADAFVSKAGDPFVKFKWKVIGVAEQGYEWTVLLGFKSQGQANVTKRAVRDLGVDVDQVAGLEQLGEEVKAKTGEYFTVEVKTNGQFRNTYIQDTRPAMADLPVPAPVGAPIADVTDDESIPF